MVLVVVGYVFRLYVVTIYMEKLPILYKLLTVVSILPDNVYYIGPGSIIHVVYYRP